MPSTFEPAIRKSPALCTILSTLLLFGLSSCSTAPTQPTRASGSAAESAYTQSVSSEYRVGPEDILHISVWREDDLDRKVLVRPDGGISFPLAGDVQVSGRTPLEIQDEIRSRLQRYLQDAEVTVSVDKISGYTVFVLGEVEEPGQFTLGRYVDVVQAVTLAGGFTPYANNRDIQVLRRRNGSEVTFNFDFRDVSKGQNLQQNIVLQSGDVVLIP